jgi:RNA polymerase sigma-70 factor (ECF subfamily)
METRLDPECEQAIIEKSHHNPTAFRDLYNYYFPRVYAYVGYRVGRPEDIEDIVADTFMNVVESLNDFRWRGNGSFAAWLFRIAHNRVNSFYRRDRNKGKLIPLENLPNVRANDPLPAENALRKERLFQLRQLITTLSPRRQEIISLKFFGGLRNNEIALALGLKERTVSSHLSRGLKELHLKYLNEINQPEKESVDG